MFNWKKSAKSQESVVEPAVTAEASPLADKSADDIVKADAENNTADAVQNIAENSTENVAESAPEKKGFFARLKDGLSKTRNNIAESFNNLFKASELDDDFYEELEETLVMSDMGYETTENIIENLKQQVKEQHIKEVEQCRQLIVNIIRDQMTVDETAYDFENKKTVVFVIGVNGVGKTTSIGKLAAQYKARGKKVLMAAADTFRAAAIDQLKTWANRAGVDIICQNEGADPSAVVYDAVAAAKARNTDILLIDTAGRLHNKKNLMDELAKMRRIISKEYPEANVETLIVLDGTTGQNALEQARQFSSVTEINGIIITKLDGTAKGGIAIAIQAELNVPVKYIGIGEKITDLQRFDPNSYVTALFADFDMKSDIEILIDQDIEPMKPDDDLFDI
ncbi:MAG: signal recognition particle-docking protein FtsY [Wujia sp.]